MVVEIQLTHGKVALVDDVFADYVRGSRWHLDVTGSNRFYARRNVYCADGKHFQERMHRVIMSSHLGRSLDPSEEIDHINHNGLDNRVENLRIVTRWQNNANQRPQKRPKSSQYKGVCLLKNRRWQAQIKVNGKSVWLGSFRDEKNAARAYNEAALRYFGEFAHPNAIEG
jgi:hypothetical protein